MLRSWDVEKLESWQNPRWSRNVDVVGISWHFPLNFPVSLSLIFTAPQINTIGIGILAKRPFGHGFCRSVDHFPRGLWLSLVGGLAYLSSFCQDVHTLFESDIRHYAMKRIYVGETHQCHQKSTFLHSSVWLLWSRWSLRSRWSRWSLTVNFTGSPATLHTALEDTSMDTI